MIKHGEFVVFKTKESDGEDICIMDSVGRRTFIHETDIQRLVDSLNALMGNFPTHSVDMSLEELFDDD